MHSHKFSKSSLAVELSPSVFYMLGYSLYIQYLYLTSSHIRFQYLMPDSGYSAEFDSWHTVVFSLMQYCIVDINTSEWFADFLLTGNAIPSAYTYHRPPTGCRRLGEVCRLRT